MRFSACIDMLFVPESQDPAERIRLARAAGMDAVEFWRWSNKDIDAIAAALAETGLKLAGILAEPVAPLTDPKSHDEFLRGLQHTLAVAHRLGTKMLIAQAGPDSLPELPGADQRAALVAVLRAPPISRGHRRPARARAAQYAGRSPGIFPAIDRGRPRYRRRSRRPEIALLYDLYHSMVMGEVTAEVLAGRVDRLAHIHIADHPGRHQPGTGRLDLGGSLDWLFANGYAGYVGLEFRPTKDTASALAQMRSPSSASASSEVDPLGSGEGAFAG